MDAFFIRNDKDFLKLKNVFYHSNFYAAKNVNQKFFWSAECSASPSDRRMLSIRVISKSPSSKRLEVNEKLSVS